MCASFSEMERELIRECVKLGLMPIAAYLWSFLLR